jgi:RHS repeat-associated protein
VGSIDALGNASQVVTDALGRVMAGVDALGALTRTLYDGHGNVAQRVDPDGNLWQYTYDRLNRETVRTDPLGAKVTTSYDDAGRVTQIVDRDGRTRTYGYDNLNRLTSDSATGSYTYDNGGNLLTASNTVGTITDSYDVLGRLTSAMDVFGLNLTYKYDNADRVTEVDDSKNGVLTRVYDNANRVTTMMFAGSGQTQARVDLAYSNRNELTGVTRYSDVGGSSLAGTTSFGYDDASRVTAITAKNSTGATLSYYNYFFDNGDRVTQESWGSGASSGTHTYAYDTTNQLTNADGTTFTYDSNGNRTAQGSQTYQVATSNRITNDGTFTYTYDAEGNLTQKSKGANQETWYYGYDGRNFLTSVRETSNGTTNQYTVTYTYDTLGRRVQQDVWNGSTVTTKYAFGADNRVWAELNGSTVVQYRYLNGDGPTASYARINVSGATVAWDVQDRLGSVRDVIDTTQVNDHVEYKPFGDIASESNLANGIPLMFTGLYEDRTSLEVLAWWRPLNTQLGQWNSEDPKMFRARDPNLRRYVGNNSTNRTDPSGLAPPDSVDTAFEKAMASGNPKVMRDLLETVRLAGTGLSDEQIALLTQAAVRLETIAAAEAAVAVPVARATTATFSSILRGFFGYGVWPRANATTIAAMRWYRTSIALPWIARYGNMIQAELAKQHPSINRLTNLFAAQTGQRLRVFQIELWFTSNGMVP